MQGERSKTPQEVSRPADVAAMVALTELRNRIGPVYGSETIALMLYALIRRERPRAIVELGTGLGVSALWMAQAVKENGFGKVWTIDDGSHWTDRDHLRRALAPLAGAAPFDRLDLASLDYPGVIRGLIDGLGLGAHASFLHEHLDLGVATDFTPSRHAFLAEPIDLIFLDIFRTPEPILDTLFYFLPYTAPCVSVFIDSASTSAVSYLFLETLVDQLNHGKVPWRFVERADDARRRLLTELIAARRFRLTHLVERLNRAQNSTAWLKIEPVDHMPHPATAMKWV
ncbi:MAG: class I SAM-dependent methyltransferase [Alphaproteobacteria bacterium]